MLGPPLSHISLSHSTLSLFLHSLSLTLSGSGCSDVRTIGPTPLVPRYCTLQAHTICTLDFHGGLARVLLVQASERDEGPSQVVASTHSGSGIIAPGWHTRRRGCRFQNPTRSANWRAPGHVSTRPPVSSEKVRSAIPALSSRRLTPLAVRAAGDRLPCSHFLLFG